jgi:divalent metal cation (Fe/Co/Zn/Cd) transporter
LKLPKNEDGDQAMDRMRFLILAGTAAFLARECQSLLTGEGVSPDVRASIQHIASIGPGVVRPNEILTMHFGPRDVLVALSLDFEDRRSAGDVEAAVTRIERRIKAAHPEVSRVFVEAWSLRPIAEIRRS